MTDHHRPLRSEPPLDPPEDRPEGVCDLCEVYRAEYVVKDRDLCFDCAVVTT